MENIYFDECNYEIAKNQPEYITLKAHVDDEGIVTTCYKLSFLELIKIIFTRKLYLSIMTFKMKLQPQRLTVYNPLKK